MRSVCELLLNLHCGFKNISASHFDFSNLLITFAVTLQIKPNSYILNKFSVEYDFSKTNVEGTPYKQYVAGREADWQRDWPEDQKEGLKTFIKSWNSKNKKGMKASETGGEYRLVIKPTELHFGSTALALTIGFGAWLWCRRNEDVGHIGTL